MKAGYPPKALDTWADRAKTWAKGGEPKDLPRIDKASAKKELDTALRSKPSKDEEVKIRDLIAKVS